MWVPELSLSHLGMGKKMRIVSMVPSLHHKILSHAEFHTCTLSMLYTQHNFLRASAQVHVGKALDHCACPQSLCHLRGACLWRRA